MPVNEKQTGLLRMLPGVDSVLEVIKKDPFFNDIPKSVLVGSVRFVINKLRAAIIHEDSLIAEKDLSEFSIIKKTRNRAEHTMSPNLMRAVNATGVVVHTNLGRSILAPDVIKNLESIAGRYSNLEFDLAKGARGSRYSIVEEILCELSGAESAMVVNNNAGAVFLSLDTISRGKKVIVSRGELVEIGGSFRIPDVMAKSGAVLKEVGTTNRTHLRDYKNAIEDDTGLFLKVHTSNYSIVGFTANVSLGELVVLGEKYNILVMEDLGSGTFIDFSKYGLMKEPTIEESVSAGADVVTFSGDKLLGGPQAGVIVGKKEILDKIKQNPLARALRIDKLTLAALESTLSLYRDKDKAVNSIPTLRMLTTGIADIEKKAEKLGRLLENISHDNLHVKVFNISSKAGGGSLPLLDIPSKCVGVEIKNITAHRIEVYMRNNKPPVIGRIEERMFIMDLRTIQDDEFTIIEDAFKKIVDRI